jgi:Ca-activated chloride channel homolog
MDVPITTTPVTTMPVTTMFVWPWVLLLLFLTPVLVWFYHSARKQPGKSLLLYPNLGLLAKANAKRRRWQHHLPAVLYLSSALLVVIALARPTIVVPEIDPKAGIVLALDVSRSMRTQDITPNRFEAAREAVREFVRGLPEEARVGLVVFAGYASRVVPITDDHERVLQAVDLLSMGRGTAIGEAMLESLEAFPTLEEREALGEPERLATIILLSDGRNRNGIDPLEALEQVKAQRVTVHTIGVGNPNANLLPGSEGFSGFNEADLRTIAEETGGQFVFADSASVLNEAYQDFRRTLMWQFGRDEATSFVALAAGLILFISVSMAQLKRRIL